MRIAIRQFNLSLLVMSIGTPFVYAERVRFEGGETEETNGSPVSASQDFPVTEGALQAVKQKDDAIAGDAWVAKIGSDGRLVYSTYLGGGGTDWGQSIAVDSTGWAIITGVTRSSTENIPFPTTPNAFQPEQGDPEKKRLCMDGFTTNTDSWVFSVMCTDGFVARLNATGTGLDYSSYIGGAKDDRGMAVALDADGNIWNAGKSEGFAQIRGQPSILPGAATEGSLMKLDVNGALVYATGTAPVPNALALDASGSVYLTGKAAGVTATPGAAQASPPGGDDAFVAKIEGGSLPPRTETPGDANGDGKVNLADAVLVLQTAVGLRTLEPKATAAGDVTGDGRVTIADAVRVLRMAVGLVG